jgi:hypothetical protein
VLHAGRHDLTTPVAQISVAAERRNRSAHYASRPNCRPLHRRSILLAEQVAVIATLPSIARSPYAWRCSGPPLKSPSEMGRVIVAQKSSDFGDRLIRVAEEAACPSLQCILHEIGKSDAECLQLPLQSSCSHSGFLTDACKFRVLVEQFEPDQGRYICY